MLALGVVWIVMEIAVIRYCFVKKTTLRTTRTTSSHTYAEPLPGGAAYRGGSAGPGVILVVLRVVLTVLDLALAVPSGSRLAFPMRLFL